MAFSQELAYLGTEVNTALRYETKPAQIAKKDGANKADYFLIKISRFSMHL